MNKYLNILLLYLLAIILYSCGPVSGVTVRIDENGNGTLTQLNPNGGQPGQPPTITSSLNASISAPTVTATSNLQGLFGTGPNAPPPTLTYSLGSSNSLHGLTLNPGVIEITNSDNVVSDLIYVDNPLIPPLGPYPTLWFYSSDGAGLAADTGIPYINGSVLTGTNPSTFIQVIEGVNGVTYTAQGFPGGPDVGGEIIYEITSTDNVAVPEPSTYLLLGSTLMMVGGYKLRRTQLRKIG